MSGIAVPIQDKYAQSRRIYQRAQTVFPGGTTRATIANDPHPVYVASAAGACVTDVDGNSYTDFANNFTTLIHGHAYPPVVAAIIEQAAKGTCFSNPTNSEIELAEIICARVPSIDKIRFVNTGTEAVMFAIKAARAFTGRSKIAKFENAYHGGYDWAEVSENSTPSNWGRADAPLSVAPYAGIPESVLQETLVLPLNAHEETLNLMRQHAADLAGILIDVMPSRAGMTDIDPSYFSMLREFTQDNDILLIDDEVLNFRQGYAGAAARIGLTPDLVTLGKIIGGGLPIGAVGGRADVMSVFDNSSGPAKVPQGGTFSANPLSMVAGIASMRALDQIAFDRLEELGASGRGRLQQVFDETGVSMSVTGHGSLFRLHPKRLTPKHNRDNYHDPAERGRLQDLQAHLLTNGIMLAAGGLGCISTAMTTAHIDQLVDAVYSLATIWKNNNRCTQKRSK